MTTVFCQGEYMKWLQGLFLLILYCMNVYADVSAIEQYKIKKKAKKNNCYVYIEINGNSDWEKKKHELNTKINDEAPFCNKITIMKIISNVNIKRCKKKSWDDIYDLNIGTIIEENPGVDIDLITQIKNSYINCGVLLKSKVNIGTHIQEDDSMSEYKNRVEVDNSSVGTGYILDVVAKHAKDFLDD